LFLSIATVAQTSGPYSVAANQTTSSLHSGTQGGIHEHVEVTHTDRAGQEDAPVVMRIVYFDKNAEGQTVELTIEIEIPAGQKRSFHGDVKSVVIVAGATAAEGEYKISYPH